MNRHLDITELAGALPVTPGRPTFWSEPERTIIRERYPRGGPRACKALLPFRSLAAIRQMAQAMGVRRLDGAGAPMGKARHRQSEAIDEAIRRAYLGPRGSVSRLAKTLGRSRSAVRDRAQVLGLVVPVRQPHAWAPAELDILRANGAQHPNVIRLKLRAAGFERTTSAIQVRKRGLKIRQAGEGDRYTLNSLSAAFGVSREAVRAWVNKGWLYGGRHRAHSAPQGTPPADGAQWRFTPAEVRRFVMENVAAVDFRKVDKFWLVDLLAGPIPIGTGGRD